MGMERPEISIIVPLYKGASFVKAALNSVFSQSFEAWECICVDDDSRDGTGEIAEGLAVGDRRVRVLHQENGGTSVARNTALDVASGRYVAFLDEDDIYHPKCLEVLHSAAVRSGADAVGMDFVSFGESASPAFCDPPSTATEVVYDVDGIRELASKWYDGAPWEVWRHVYRREVVDGIRFPAGVRIEQDLRWHYELLPRFKKYVHVPWAGYGWRLNSNGGVLNPHADNLLSEVDSFRCIAESLPRQMGFSEEQTRCFKARIAAWCKAAIVAPVRGGVRFSRRDFKAFRIAVEKLEAAGVDLRTALGLRKRILWALFMSTGIEAFVRL
jgi:glycosyltransferase involved in cell wall biosynthesis